MTPSSRRRRALTWAALLAGALVGWEMVALDGPFVLLVSRLYPGETVFAPRYSAWGFWRVSKGDTREEVEGLVGPPLHRRPAAADRVDPRVVEVWVYAESPSGSHHHQRLVMFNAAGRVSDVWAGYYVQSPRRGDGQARGAPAQNWK